MTVTETRTFVLPNESIVELKVNDLSDSLAEEHYTVDVHYYVENVVIVATRAVEI